MSEDKGSDISVNGGGGGKKMGRPKKSVSSDNVPVNKIKKIKPSDADELLKQKADEYKRKKEERDRKKEEKIKESRRLAGVRIQRAANRINLSLMGTQKAPPPSKRDVIVMEAYLKLKEGIRPIKVVENLIYKHAYKKNTAMLMVHEAANRLKQETVRDAQAIVALHDLQYDDIIYKNVKAYNNWIEQPQSKRDYAINYSVIEQLKTALNALKQKERMLGLHKKDAKLKYSASLAQDFEVAIEVDEYDVSDLTFEEQVELLGLIKKCKIGYEEIQSSYGLIRVDNSIEDANVEEDKESKRLEDMKRMDVYDVSNIVTTQEVESDIVSLGSVVIHDEVKGVEDKSLSSEDVAEKLKNAMIEKIKKKYER